MLPFATINFGPFLQNLDYFIEAIIMAQLVKAQSIAAIIGAQQGFEIRNRQRLGSITASSWLAFIKSWEQTIDPLVLQEKFLADQQYPLECLPQLKDWKLHL